MCVAKLNENPGREPWSSDYWKSLWVPILVFNTRWIIFLTYSLYKLQYLFEKNRNNWKETGDGPFCLKKWPVFTIFISKYFCLLCELRSNSTTIFSPDRAAFDVSTNSRTLRVHLPQEYFYIPSRCITS